MYSMPRAWARFSGAGLLLLVGAMGSGCAHASAESEPAAHGASTAVVVRSQDTCPVELARNGTLELHLEGNPSTGYAWEITHGATGVLTSHGAASQEGESGVPGAPADYVFSFDGAAAGAAHLTLVYRQPWDTAATPARTFDCDVTVR